MSPSPLDLGPVRAWSRDEGSAFCMWCDMVNSMLSSASGSAEIAAIGLVPHGSPTWAALLQAYFMLRLESDQVVTMPALATKFNIIKRINVPAAFVSTSSAASGTASTASSAIPAVSDPNYVTPKKSLGVKAEFASPLASSASIADPSGSQAEPSATPPVDARMRGGARCRPSPTSSMGSAVGGPCDEEEDEDDLGPEDEDELPRHDVGELPPMSLDARMPSGQTGTNMARMRATAKGYVAKLCIAHWVLSMKPPTVKALWRRLGNQKDGCEASLNLDFISAYKALRRRVRCLLDLHKGLMSWKSSQVDSNLRDVLVCLNSLAPFMEKSGMVLSPDLFIVKVQANFQYMLDSNHSVHQAATGEASRCVRG